MGGFRMGEQIERRGQVVYAQKVGRKKLTIVSDVKR